MQYDITKFGAIADGRTLNTQAIQAAIDACAAGGGGQVIVPPGRFVTGTLRLKSGVFLSLSAGGQLLASTSSDDYESDVHKCMYGDSGCMDRCLIFAREAKNIGIIGQGTIDGRGASFPNSGDPRKHRPMLVRLVDCEDILLRDVLLQNPASWSVAMLYCRGICADNVRVRSRANDDGVGLAFDGCRDVRVSNCSFDTSDDSIWLQASRTDRNCSDVTISNCNLRGRSTGIRIGLLSVGTIHDIAISNCVFSEMDDAAIKIQVNEGGIIENVRLVNLVIREVPRAALVTLNRHRVCVDSQPTIPPMGALRSIRMQGLSMVTRHKVDRKAALIVVGSPDGKIEDISISDADVTVFGGGEAWDGPLSLVRELGAGRPEHKAQGGALPAWGLYARHVRGLALSAVRYTAEEIDARPNQVLDDVT